ncbi:hypothetical protein [Parerythrobacter jejuensis]|uniref:DUF4440 domain-containing protein n=1 Tax=Parerythrobacter jejuensis TaxID=795812 RepID=A0A845AUH6_9SPHN|nr:hypothetical protein [Parerythrobacter jejuensis]MXP31240.1 hypothetical protein [Parerythrobacter jejuensis]MXP34000.1 hypothetical protein [Parerythrobacter jejuensis]
MRRALAMTLALAVAACASQPNGPRGPRIAPGANPSAVVTTELAFARTVREEGFAKAYREFATDSAVIFDETGPRQVRDWLDGQSGDIGTMSWDPKRILMSCDGSVAASLGTFDHPLGLTGTYTTIWQRQANGDYRILIDFPSPGEEWSGLEDIIETHVAECDASTPDARARSYSPVYAEMDRDATAMNVQSVSGISQDTSFAWFAGHASPSDRGVMLSVFVDGAWKTFMGQRLEATDPNDPGIEE